jgi:D-alanyl-D-alanine carboxypeptidase (penicillin-binding protein 5/6)
MAERIGGTEENFVKMMNDKASELGLVNTHFVNAYGFDDDDHYSTAYDMAMIAKELVKHEKILEFSGTYEDYLRKDTDNSFWLVNTNRLVRYYSGVDGLKTGFTDNAMYCLTATALKNNMRLITVVMGEPDSTTRSSETAAMLDYGFNTYQIDTLLSSDYILDKVKVYLGKDEYVDVVASEDINILNSKVGTKRNTTYKINLDDVKAPVKVGDSVGKIDVYEDDNIIMTVDVTVKEDVEKANIVLVYLRNIKDILLGSI